jgi:hypothetical protein
MGWGASTAALLHPSAGIDDDRRVRAFYLEDLAESRSGILLERVFTGEHAARRFR